MSNGISAAEIALAAHRLIAEAKSEAIPVSVFGSVAILLRAENCSDVQIDARRSYKDIDCASFSPNQERLDSWLISRGWRRSEQLFLVTEGARSIYHSNAELFSLDIFFDDLNFCHRIPLHPLEDVAGETLSAGNLLLSKIQRADPSQRDFEDIVALLACSAPEFSSPDKPALKKVLKLLSSDWGFYHTAAKTLEAIRSLIVGGKLSPPLVSLGAAKRTIDTVEILMKSLRRSSKTVSWKTRSLFGEIFPWYSVVESVDEPF